MKGARRMLKTCIITMLLVVLSIGGGAGVVSAAHVWDYYGLYGADEVQELEKLGDQFEEAHGINLFLQIVDNSDVGGSSDRDTVRFIEAFSDEHFAGDGAIGLIINMESRYFYLDISGNYPLNVYTDRRQEEIEDAVADALSDGDYTEAARAFIRSASDVAETAETWDDQEAYRDYENGHYGSVHGVTPGRVGLSAVVALVVAGIVLAVLLSSHHEKKIARNAGNYMVAGSLDLKVRVDRMVHTYVTKVPRAQNNSGSGGGTSIHHSSGGHSHSGGGRHF